MSEPLGAIETVDVDGIDLHVLTMQQTVDVVMEELRHQRGGLLLTANVDIMLRLTTEPDLHLAERSRLVVADGMPVVWASRLQGGTRLPERVTGADLVWRLSGAAAQEGRSIFLLGAGPGVADKAAQAFIHDYPGLRVVGTECPPKGFEADDQYMASLVAKLQEAKPDIVFVALGFPKQERVALRLLQHLPSTWFMGCGGALDMAAGDTPRAHSALQRLGVEWMHRLYLEPRRLAHRYLVDDVPYAAGLVGRAASRRLRKRS